MNPGHRLLFRSYVGLLKVYQKLFLELHVFGREKIPKGPKIYVANHITSTDGGWVLPVLDEMVHVVNGPGYNWPLCARILDALGQINAMPAHRNTVVPKAVEYLERGEAVFVTPEGDIQEPFQLGRFYPGVAKMYRRIRVPIVPIALVAPKKAMRRHRASLIVEGRAYRAVSVLRGPFLINIGDPLLPDYTEGTDREQDEHIMGIIKRRIESLVEDARLNKFWLPPSSACLEKGWC